MLRDLNEYIGSKIQSQKFGYQNVGVRATSRARANIGSSFSDHHVEHVHEYSTAKHTSLAVLNVPNRHTLLSKLAGRRDLHTVQITPSRSEEQFVIRIRQLDAKTNARTVFVDDEETAVEVLNGLQAHFHSLIASYILRTQHKDFSLNFVKSRLLEEE